MTKNAKVISPAQATSATQTTSWEWSAPYFVKRAQEVQARLDLQRQTMNDLQGQYKNLQKQNRNLQDQNKNQKKDYEREMNGCIGSFVVVVLLFAAVILCGYRRSSSPERCSYALGAKAVQMTATPTTITVTLPVATTTTVTITLPVATNAAPSIEAAPTFSMTPTADQVWTGLTQGQILSIILENNRIQARYNENYRAWSKEEDRRFWCSYSSKYSITPTPTPARFNENYRAWSKKENDEWWEQWDGQEAQRKSEDQKFWSSWSSKYSITPTPTPAR